MKLKSKKIKIVENGVVMIMMNLACFHTVRNFQYLLKPIVNYITKKKQSDEQGVRVSDEERPFA